MTIFDMVTSVELAAYWDELTQDRRPFVGEELFPGNKKLGIDLKWIKGNSGLPVVLRTSAFDVQAIPRARIGFERLSAEMPFFKESTYIDEELRQELNKVIESGNQAIIDSILNQVFNDLMRLVESAGVSRERMRMMALTTGVVAMASNGQTFVYDYDIPAANKTTAATSWSLPTATIIDDIRTVLDQIEDETGERPTRAICTRKTFNYMLKNQEIKNAVFVLSAGVGALNDARVRSYIADELEIEILINDKRYRDDSGTVTKYVPDDTFVLFPAGPLGTTWFGTTPEESDLLTSSVANVSVVDIGVAITTMQRADPVNVETKVTQIVLPSFEQANKVGIIDVQ